MQREGERHDRKEIDKNRRTHKDTKRQIILNEINVK